MNNEKHFYTTPFLFESDVQEIQDALIIAQNHWGDKRNGTLDWDAYCQARINEFERVLNKFTSATWKELPEPPKEISLYLCLFFSECVQPNAQRDK